MSNNPLDFKDKKDRNDFLIALPVILFFGWLLFYFSYQRPGDLDLSGDEIALSSTAGVDIGDFDNDGVQNDNDNCPYEPGLAADNGCPQDRDGDGVEDYYDRCPNTVGTKENKGCPALMDEDPDGDGFIGEEDRCPDVAGTDAGCPPASEEVGVAKAEDTPDKVIAEKKIAPVDQDLDGVPDGMDECPTEKGPASNKGCPVKIADQDEDGVPDSADKCPTEKGPATNNGCPVKIADKDGDGVPDAEDDCPNRAGPIASKGCPEVKMTAAEKKVISEAISSVVFLPSSANLTEYSKGLVIKIAALMKKYPDAKLKISGYTDSIGQDNSNLQLSKDRAAACLRLLAKQGVSKERMSSQGFGESNPIADNNTKAGRQKNRRVEFKLSY